MKKTITKQWIKALALMALMVSTAVVANAADRYYLRGGVTDDSPGWSSNDYMLRPVSGSSDKYYVDFPAASGFQFKLVYVADGTDEEVWIGSNQGGYDHVAQNIPYTFTEVKKGEGSNMIISPMGTCCFAYDVTNEELQITYIPCPINVPDADALEGGKLTVDKTEAAQGETVTITATPDYGYVCDKDMIKIELTIDGGNAHAPRPKNAPTVGEFFHPEGDVVATHDTPATYTFTMPDAPLDVFINATFTQATVTGINKIDVASGTDGRSVHYFNLQGRYIGSSLDGAAHGIYVTGNGRKVIK